MTCGFCGKDFAPNGWTAFRCKGGPPTDPAPPKCPHCRTRKNSGLGHGGRRKVDNLALERAFGVQAAPPTRHPRLCAASSDLFAPAPPAQDEAAAREIREAFAASAVAGLGGFDEDAPIGGRP